MTPVLSLLACVLASAPAHAAPPDPAAADTAPAGPAWTRRVSVSGSYVSEIWRPGVRVAVDVGLAGTRRGGATHEAYAGPVVGVQVFPGSYTLAWAGGEVGYRLVTQRRALFELFATPALGVRVNAGETVALVDGDVVPTSGVSPSFTPVFGWGAGQDFGRAPGGLPAAWFFRMSAMVRPDNDTVGAAVLFELGGRWTGG